MDQPIKIQCRKCGSTAWNSEETTTIYYCDNCGEITYFIAGKGYEN
jgi:ribosomal protein L37E